MNSICRVEKCAWTSSRQIRFSLVISAMAGITFPEPLNRQLQEVIVLKVLSLDISSAVDPDSMGSLDPWDPDLDPGGQK